MSAVWACLRIIPTTLEQACGCSRTSPPWSSTALPTEWATSPWNKKFHLFISSAFAKELRKLWQASYRAAPASTTGIGQGSKIYVAFLNFVAAYSTTSDKCKALQMADSTPTRASFTTHGRTLGLARSSAGAKDARLTRFDDRTYVRARVCPFGV